VLLLLLLLACWPGQLRLNAAAAAASSGDQVRRTLCRKDPACLCLLQHLALAAAASVGLPAWQLAVAHPLLLAPLLASWRAQV
jgi:hypothetical protein